ncbi:ABC transporter ATP-binding protein [Bradyrhizobium sp. McL0616]|uniref:ABC transporter ATP-binding protein n=1 Tax=Bradyrhizobium sp. McL0616 TaxID=3415674 RepID=UPI003CFA6357
MADSIDKLQVSITKRYGGKVVLDHLPLEVRGREFVTFLGPSGCGKSTALGIIAGLVLASDGEMHLNGRRIDDIPPEKRGFGMVFQNYALFPHLTVFGNVAFGLELQNRPAAEIRQRVQEMLGLVRLAGYEDRYPGQLSGGQQQRVAIARALVLHPRLMLFDEPLSNLDAKLRVEMRAEIKQLHARLGLTSIYVTHDQAEALSLSDRIVVLREGVLMQVGTPQDIHDRPKNVFVADFMGFRNFFDVTLGPEAGGVIEGTFRGLALQAKAREGYHPGEDAVLAIRPEDVRLGRPADGANALRGKVELVEYLGREQEAEISLDGGARLWVRSLEKLSPGDTLDLTLPADKLVLLRRE